MEVKMKTRILHTKFWKDSFVAELTPVEKLIFNYLLTNENITILHLYECSDREIMFDTGATKDQVTRAKEKLQEAGKVFFYKDYILLGNADRYESYMGERNDVAKEKLKKELPKDVLDWYNNISDRGIEGVYIPSINHKQEIINNKERVVKGKQNSIDYLRNLPEDLVTQFSDYYNCSPDQVRSKAQDIINYCKANGKTYKDYHATIHVWLKKDYGLRVKKVQFIPQEAAPEISEEERLRVRMRFEQMKQEKLGKILRN